MTRALAMLSTLGLLAAAGAVPAQAATDPGCTGNYAPSQLAPPRPLRFGVDPGIAGSIGGTQTQSVPDQPLRDLAGVRRLRPRGRPFVARLNRLFWSEGNAGIARFRRLVHSYASAGLDVEIQVRYHPSQAEAGNVAAWTRYVRDVVDALGANHHVVAMTITNEVNVTFSPNTSDGSYPRAEDALIRGIEAAHREAARRGFRWLRFGFTYAYRFVPSQDAAFFTYMRAHGGPAFLHALGFVGLDFYPGTIFPPVVVPNGYGDAFAQAAGTLRSCFAPMAGIGRRVPIWVTENGIPSGTLTESQQADALSQLVTAAHQDSRTLGITDYRWFNLRDAKAEQLAPPPLSFAYDGLLSSDYSVKPAFAVYRRLVARFS